MTSRTLVGFALCQGGTLLTCMLLAASLRGQFTRDPLQYETPAGVVEEKGAARLDRFN